MLLLSPLSGACGSLSPGSGLRPAGRGYRLPPASAGGHDNGLMHCGAWSMRDRARMVCPTDFWRSDHRGAPCPGRRTHPTAQRDGMCAQVRDVQRRRRRSLRRTGPGASKRGPAQGVKNTVGPRTGREVYRGAPCPGRRTHPRLKMRDVRAQVRCAPLQVRDVRARRRSLPAQGPHRARPTASAVRARALRSAPTTILPWPV